MSSFENVGVVGAGMAVGMTSIHAKDVDNTQDLLSFSVHDILNRAYGERFQSRPLLCQLAAAGDQGRRAGRGWHRYDSGGKRQ